MIDTEWHSGFKECGPFNYELEWDKSWRVPVEFKMFDGTIKTVDLVYDEKDDCFYYDPNNEDFCIDDDIYDIDAWRFPVLPEQVNTKNTGEKSMSQQIRFQIFKSVSGMEYHLAINGVLLNGKQTDDGLISVDTDMLASMFSMPELSDMIESKKRHEEYTKQHFVSNRELAEWLNAKEGRHCHVVYPNQMIRDGMIYTEWKYTEETADCNASAGFDIYVVNEDACTLHFLTRKVIGLE